VTKQTREGHDMKNYRVTVTMRREYSATIAIRAGSQAEADLAALAAFHKWAWEEADGRWLRFPPPWTEHESYDEDPEIDTRSRCVDCGKEAEYYMVADELWAASGLDPNGGMLCLADLERRTGRELTIGDFTSIVPTREAWERHIAAREPASE
jgi:hypothetical protein